MRDGKMKYSTIDSPLGPLLALRDSRGLSGLYMQFQKYGKTPGDDWQRDDGALAAVAEQLAAYFAGELDHFDVPLSLSGTEFQRRVWQALCDVPCGETQTYGQLARRIGSPSAVRAVGAAVGRNPVSIIVPCHRILGADGSLTGYAGGLERKRWLLDHEERFRGVEKAAFSSRAMLVGAAAG